MYLCVEPIEPGLPLALVTTLKVFPSCYIHSWADTQGIGITACALSE
jgi:hypothetical protein